MVEMTIAIMMLMVVSGLTPMVVSDAVPVMPNSTLEIALQSLVDNLGSQYGYALQLGWKSATHEFTIAGGEYEVPPTYTSKAKVTPADTFLFGSGTKPFTAAAVMGLVARGVVNLNDPIMQHIDTVLDTLDPGTTFTGLFGEDAKKITVGHVLRMQSGIQDFDQPKFDEMLLQPNETYKVHSPIEIIKYAASTQKGLLFEPGTQVCYSSTNYDLAGLVMLAHAPSKSNWTTLDIRSFFPDDVTGKGYFYGGTEKINDRLNIPGNTGGGFAHLPKLKIYNQSSSILGWTCGNLVATTGDVANFIWDLLGPTPQVLPRNIVSEMTQFKPLSFGWAKGYISYGTGLMVEASSMTNKYPPTFSEFGTYMGHGGDTYGFLSEQGILYGLNASCSVIANQDGDSSFVQQIFMCKVIETATKVLLNKDIDLKCRELL